LSLSLFDSLVLGGVIELAGGENGVTSTNPMCPGAVFKVDPDSWDLGDPQPTTDFVATLATDGERPFGTRTSDRTPEITVNINAPDYLTLAGAEELLLSTLEQQQWTMVWTPRLSASQITAGQVSLPVVYDCFRAQPSKKKWGGPTGYNNESGTGPWSTIVIKFEALPYGRSDTKTQLAFTSPVAAQNAPAPPPAPVVLDNFATINSPQVVQSQTCIVGPYTAYWDPANPPYSTPDGANSPLIYPRTFTTPVNLTGQTALKHWLGLGSRYYFNHQPRGRSKVTVSYTLTDTAGNTLSWTAMTPPLPVSQNPQSPSWSLVSVRIPQTNPLFNMAQVVSYEMTIFNRGPSQLRPKGELRWLCATLDQLTAYPSTVIAGVPSNRGTLYHVNGVPGTHYAPVSIVAQSPPTAGSATVLTTVGAGFYTVPPSTLYVGVDATGGGGPGATMTTAGVGGGGSGAGMAGELQLPGSAAGVVIPYQIGAGGTAGVVPAAGQPTSFGPVPGQSLVVTAPGGLAAATNSATGALGGTATGNSIEYPGGQGRTASGGLGGGGGSSAGTAAAGNTPAGTSVTDYTSSGSFVIPSGAGPVTLGLWGAGGGGAGGPYGGAGGGGEYIQVTLTLTAGTYPFTIGGGGSGGSSGGNGNNGGATTITIGSVTYTANGGMGGQSGNFFYGGGDGGDGGSGSGSPGEQPGGDGGDGYPYSGGGGSSAAPGSAGNSGSTYGQAGVAPTGGGNGGAGQGTGSGNGQAGQGPGGGGGGATSSGHSGGAGAGGQLSVTYSGAGAPTSSGATAPAGGGNGGAGGATAGTTGSGGSQPGGGGGGGNSSGGTELGGNGGNGQVTVIPYGNAAFTTLLLHRPGLQSPVNLNPLIPLNGVAPGTTEFPVQAIQQGATTWGFEDGTTDSWTATLAAVANSVAWANSGSHSLLITASGSSGAWGATSPAGTSGLPVAPGQQVMVSATVENPNASTTLNQVEIGISWYTASGSPISTTTSAARAVAANGGVATLTLSAQAPATAAFAAATILDNETVAASVKMAIDDITIGPAVNARFDGTYTGMLVAASWNNPSAARTLQLTVNQYEAAGGTKWSTSTTAISVTPNLLPNGTPFVNLGNITLPGKAIPADNLAAYFTCVITDSNGSDEFWDLILIDNNGQTLIIAEPAGAGYVTYYVDEPDSKYDMGGVYGSQSGRPQAISVTDAIQAWSGGPLTLQPGDNTLLAYSLAGAPSISVELFTRWFHQRLE
jgi:hypothetical protein